VTDIVPERGKRLRVAFLVGLAAALATYLAMLNSQVGYPGDRMGADFTYWWRAARALLVGQNPYEVIRPAGYFPLDGVFAYPLPAAVVAIPFAPLPPRLGAAVFVGCGFALAAYGLSAFGWWRVSALASAPAFWIFENAQWTPLLLGASLVPSFGWLLVCKPTIGAALFVWRPTRRAFVGGAALTALALLVLPTWPLDWIAILRSNSEGAQYVPPLAVPGGLLLVLGLLRWRRPEARLLLTMALVPQNYFFYDQLPLLLVPSRRASLLLFAFWTHILRLIAFLLLRPETVPGWHESAAVRSAWIAPFILWGMYVPCLLLVLRRPNVGPAPAWLERGLARLRVPARLAGHSVPARDQSISP
jgi:hypothetical protein